MCHSAVGKITINATKKWTSSPVVGMFAQKTMHCVFFFNLLFFRECNSVTTIWQYLGEIWKRLLLSKHLRMLSSAHVPINQIKNQIKMNNIIIFLITKQLLKTAEVKDLKNVKVLNLPEVLGGLHLEVLVNQATLEIQYRPAKMNAQQR